LIAQAGSRNCGKHFVSCCRIREAIVLDSCSHTSFDAKHVELAFDVAKVVLGI